MRRVRDGDVASLEDLFVRHAAAVYGLCARLTSREAAEDLVQDVFLRVLRYRESWRGERSFVGWLYRIARNAATDHLARERREKDAAATWEEHAASADEADERSALLEAALRRLPYEQREIIVLARWHDLPSERIAEILDCTPGAARVRLHRALSELRDIVLELESQSHGLRGERRTDRC